MSGDIVLDEISKSTTSSITNSSPVETKVQQSYAVNNIDSWILGTVQEITVVPILQPIGFMFSVDENVPVTKSTHLKTKTTVETDDTEWKTAAESSDVDYIPVKPIHHGSQTEAISPNAVDTVQITRPNQLYTVPDSTYAQLPLPDELEEQLKTQFTTEEITDYTGISLYQVVDVSYVAYATIQSSQIVKPLTVKLATSNSIQNLTIPFDDDLPTKINFQSDTSQNTIRIQEYSQNKRFQSINHKFWIANIGTNAFILLFISVTVGLVSFGFITNFYIWMSKIEKEAFESSAGKPVSITTPDSNNPITIDYAFATEAASLNTNDYTETETTISTQQAKITTTETGLKTDVETNSEPKTVTWTFDDTELVDTTVLQFFFEYGLESDLDSFSASIAPTEQTISNDITTLKSDCGNWYLLPY